MTHRQSDSVGIDFAKGNGLVPVIVQDHRTGAVLMLGYANEDAVDRTMSTGNLHFWSRSRGEIWLKGEKSGNYLRIYRLSVDCDGDTLLAEVEPATGETPICHTGADTCFFTHVISEDRR
jgi:phosphoribosyl-AMP cyclohydrolase / phosphoribosyl-ATP pyrophosphohydrolase